MSEPPPEFSDASIWRKLRLVRPYGGLLSLVIGLLGLLAMTDMVQPYFLKILIDDVFVPGRSAERSWGLLWLILPGMGLIYVTRNTLFYSSRMLSLRVSEDICFELRKRLFEHLQRLSLSFYRSNQPGKVSARLMDDTFKIQTFLHEKLPMLLRYLIEFQVLLIVIYLVNWRLALASTIVLPLHFWTYRRFRAPIRRSHSEAQESIAVAHGSVVQQLLGMEVVKGFSAEARESRLFNEAIDASRRSKIRSQRFHFTQKVVADLIVGLGTVLLLGYGAWEVKSGRMTGGAFLMFFWYVKMLYPAVLEVISGTSHLSNATTSADRVFEMLDQPIREPTDRGGAADELPELTGRIEYEDVSFEYEDGDTQVLRDVSFVVEPGEHVAITGPSGSGKSTLISLLPRFNDPTSGRVLIDGLPAEAISIPALRGLFGIAFQEIFLFNASIDENLRYARPDATPEEIIEACRITGAHGFVDRLPGGYLTRIGEAGGELSRGEKQRLTLARALVRQPRVLIMDEATASIDPVAARTILRMILEHMAERTVIVVTHDTDLLDIVDRVISIDEGRVVYDGPPPSDDAHRRRASSGAAPFAARRQPRRFPGGAAALLVAASLGVAGCARSVETSHAISMESPRLSAGGVIIDETDPVRLERIADALDALALDPGTIRRGGVAPAPAEDQAPDVGLSATAVTFDLPDEIPESVRLVSLPKLSRTEIRELIDGLVLRLNAELGYAEAGSILADVMPAPPNGVVEDRVLGRMHEGATHVLGIGFRMFVSQPPQLRLAGVVAGEAATGAANPDLERIAPIVDELVASLKDLRSALGVRDLEAKMIQLSYVDASTAVALLAGMGVTTVAQPTEIPSTVEFDKLPYVTVVPEPRKEDVGLIGEAAMVRGEFGISMMPNVASQLSPNTVASPLTQLLVMFHPARPEQFSRVKRLLDEFIDRPARQVFVEGMILEISEEGLKDLGIEWELDAGPVSLRGGSLEAGGGLDTFGLTRFRNADFDFEWSVQIRALIEDKKAEILARPSVLTLNNRQSTIRVGTDIPIATSQEGTASFSNKIAFNFRYLPTGILLNVRPRINEDGTEVSMLIDTMVSARVPGADLEIRSSDGEVLATAPTISTRRVSTYGRIRNNTPFIIGGLVSRQVSVTQDKVPLLGDLPIIGIAFRSEKTEEQRQEVIIVLTPYVLPEEQRVSRVMPEDKDIFDTSDYELFRDSYRIRAEDVFDLSFLLENPRIVAYGELARQAIAGNFRLAETETFSHFAGGRIPGERILVARMLYEVVARLEVAQSIPMSRIIFFESHQVGGYDVAFLERALKRLSGGSSIRDFFRRHKGKALALSYFDDLSTNRSGRLGNEPIPEMAIVDCPNEEAWEELLWEMNQPLPDGRERYTILLHQEKDLLRLQKVLALKKVVSLNGGKEELYRTTFASGTLLLLPEISEEEVHVIDTDVARMFFYTEHYYAATVQEIERRLTALDEALRKPDISILLDPETPGE